MRALVRVVTWPLRVYQRTLSRWTPPMCRFTPTCSQYAIESFETHGLWHGATRTTWRLLRCQPLCRGGFDPVAGGPSAEFRAKHAGCPAPDPCERCR